MLVLGIAGVAVGVAAEYLAFGWDRPALWIPDFATGVALIGIGVLTSTRARGAGLLLTLTGVAWFIGTALPVAAFWHRGVLIQLLVAYPAVRPASRTGWVLVAAGYATALAWPLWRNDAASAVLALGALIVSVAGARTDTPRRHLREVACRSGMFLSAVVLAGSVARWVAPPGSAALLSLLAYEATLTAVAVYLWNALRPVEANAVTDLVIEVGESPSATLQDALAVVLGDPSLRLGYWQESTAEFVDSSGDILRPPAPGSGRMLTEIERRGQPFAALVHDSAVATESGLIDAVAVADRLTATHTDLLSDIQVRIEDVSASRRRLQLAADEERRRLEQRLAAGPELTLTGVLNQLRVLREPPDGLTHAHLDRAVAQLERSLVELREVAQGLYPRELTVGLRPALAELAARCPLPVTLPDVDQPLPPQVEVAAYYLCAEALSNVVKHAAASAVSIAVRIESGMLLIAVADDGVGGAEGSGGSGILGLTDRMESIGGRLRVQSEPGNGTTLTAEIPLGGRP